MAEYAVFTRDASESDPQAWKHLFTFTNKARAQEVVDFLEDSTSLSVTMTEVGDNG